MTDDLLKRSRRLDTCIFPNERPKCLCGELADRIEKLEAALRFYSCGCDLICSNFKNVVDCGYTAVKALEGKDD